MSTISASTTSTTAYKVTADTTGTLVFQTGATPTTAMTLGSDQSVTFAGTPTYSGGTANGVAYLNGSKVFTTGTALVFDGTNLGVGTSSPTLNTNGTVLHINNSTASRAAIIHMTNAESGSTGADGLICGKWSDGTNYFFDYDSNPIVFGTGGTERARIDTSGNFLVGTTTAGGAGSVRGLTIAGGSVGSLGVGLDYAGAVYKYDAVNENGWIWWNTRSIGGLVQEFFVTSSFTKVGNINCSTTATNYVTSSDYRLKENIQPMTGALAKVAQLKPCTYTWKVDGSEGQGFIAHELGEVVPQCVSGEKDAVNEDGSIDPQGIDTSFLVATLTAAIQELKAELDAAKADIATLKGAA